MPSLASCLFIYPRLSSLSFVYLLRASYVPRDDENIKRKQYCAFNLLPTFVVLSSTKAIISSNSNCFKCSRFSLNFGCCVPGIECWAPAASCSLLLIAAYSLSKPTAGTNCKGPFATFAQHDWTRLP
ncbi:hypothetical protein BOTBODRAFT_522038 [Botryobasidium botryosum FD-172 SS1]|uniref:Uncharacterized protein n=1 Tax=Botryobasidium botryosum (strain FD-172 SS1) TaxID=930990 RepID=A0A067M4H6_BOTB1|nr:hypothetical protein BOTBODRAFT_522038 [Botryobasidium botryosum FD-172 SS1]